MDISTARLVLILRCHFGCSYSKLGMIFKHCYGLKGAQELSGMSISRLNEEIGLGVLIECSRALGLEFEEMDRLKVSKKPANNPLDYDSLIVLYSKNDKILSNEAIIKTKKGSTLASCRRIGD
jgi:hypothetical protein